MTLGKLHSRSLVFLITGEHGRQGRVGPARPVLAVVAAVHTDLQCKGERAKYFSRIRNIFTDGVAGGGVVWLVQGVEAEHRRGLSVLGPGRHQAPGGDPGHQHQQRAGGPGALHTCVSTSAADDPSVSQSKTLCLTGIDPMVSRRDIGMLTPLRH